jgi:5'-nucleotidase / UDP-sugar diphosphatase
VLYIYLQTFIILPLTSERGQRISKKSKISKTSRLLVLSTAALVTGVVAADNPLQAEAGTTAADLVVKAEKLAGALKWEVSYEHRKLAYPNSSVNFPNMVLLIKQKLRLLMRKKSLKGIKGKERELLQARLDQNVRVYYDSAVKYIDAVSAGKKIQKKVMFFRFCLQVIS